jgi:hypothetical protein
MACYEDSFMLTFVPHRRHTYYRDSYTFLYVDDVRTSQETHLQASTACYGDIFTFQYLNVELHLRTFMSPELKR